MFNIIKQFMFLSLAVFLIAGCTSSSITPDQDSVINEVTNEDEEIVIDIADKAIGAVYPTPNTLVNYSPWDMTTWGSATWALGANYTNGTSTTSNYITFAVYAPDATKMMLEIYTAATGGNAYKEYWMAKGSDGIWRAKIYCTYDARMYGYRAWGPNWPLDRKSVV